MRLTVRGGPALVGLLALLPGGCGPDPRAAGGPANGYLPRESSPLTVAAAADLRFAFDEIGDLLARRTGRRPVFVFAASGQLARQIEHGAPFDLFAAANVEFVKELEEKRLIVPGTVRHYATGRLAVATRSALKSGEIGALTGPGIRRVAIANPAHAPYGRAAREALRRAGLWNRLEARLVYGENVRQALQFVATGNADAAVISWSPHGPPGVRFFAVDPRLYSPLRQALGIVAGTRSEAAARDFCALLLGPEGRSILRRHGFAPPGRPLGREGG